RRRSQRRRAERRACLLGGCRRIRRSVINWFKNALLTMPVRFTRRLAASLALTLGSGLTLAQSHEAAPSSSDAPVVYSAEVDSIIHPVSAEYMMQTMDRADRDGATLVVFT